MRPGTRVKPKYLPYLEVVYGNWQCIVLYLNIHYYYYNVADVGGPCTIPCSVIRVEEFVYSAGVQIRCANNA